MKRVAVAALTLLASGVAAQPVLRIERHLVSADGSDVVLPLVSSLPANTLFFVTATLAGNARLDVETAGFGSSVAMNGEPGTITQGAYWDVSSGNPSALTIRLSSRNGSPTYAADVEFTALPLQPGSYQRQQNPQAETVDHTAWRALQPSLVVANAGSYLLLGGCAGVQANSMAGLGVRLRAGLLEIPSAPPDAGDRGYFLTQAREAQTGMFVAHVNLQANTIVKLEARTNPTIDGNTGAPGTAECKQSRVFAVPSASVPVVGSALFNSVSNGSFSATMPVQAGATYVTLHSVFQHHQPDSGVLDTAFKVNGATVGSTRLSGPTNSNLNYVHASVGQVSSTALTVELAATGSGELWNGVALVLGPFDGGVVLLPGQPMGGGRDGGTSDAGPVFVDGGVVVIDAGRPAGLEFVSAPTGESTCFSRYRYAPQVDTDAGATFTVVNGPRGLRVLDGGTLVWTPDEEQSGTFTFTVIATAPSGAQGQQDVSVNVVCNPEFTTRGCAGCSSGPGGLLMLVLLFRRGHLRKR